METEAKEPCRTGVHFFGTEAVWKIFLKIAPPVMLAQLIQALYNIVDSLFIGKYSADGLTALSVIYPLQLIIVALAVGTGVGVNTLMARQYALKQADEADKTAGAGMVLALITWAGYAVVAALIMRGYVEASAKAAEAVEYAVCYGMIVSIGSIGIFLESIWSKVHQAQGNMKLPMLAQIAGAVTNIILDPLLIFGWGFFPELGVKGAAIATVAGQIVAAIMVGAGGFRKCPRTADLRRLAQRIYGLGYPSICMQALYTIYIAALNMILAGFGDEAVTVLGLYYKLQTFFFIPLIGLQTCIVPVLSYNYGLKNYERCQKIFTNALLISTVMTILAVLAFEFIPITLISFFSSSAKVKEIGEIGFRIIGASFIPAVFSWMAPVFFQAIGYSKTSTFLSVLRQIICLVPIFWLFSRLGLNYCWLSFPITEIISGLTGMLLYLKTIKIWENQS